MLKQLRSFSRAVLGRSAFEHDMDEELRFHLESRTADLIRRGIPAAEAARRARVEFGSVEKHKEASRADAPRHRMRAYERRRAGVIPRVLIFLLHRRSVIHQCPCRMCPGS